MRITIVGAGIMGLCTAWALHRRGHRVQVLEQGPVPNPLASSVDQHRLIRYPYGAEDGYVRMVAAGYQAWEELWADLGERLYVPTGTLCFDGAGDPWTARSRDSLARCGIAFTNLDRAEAQARFPFLNLDAFDGAIHLESGGVLLAERIVTALARHLAAAGVEIRPDTPVSEVDPETGRVVAGGTPVTAEAVIIAAGPWAPRLVPALRPRITPSRQAVVYLAPPVRWAAAWTTAPMVLGLGSDSGFYVVPPVAGTGLKIGDHRFTLAGDPDRDRAATTADTRPLVAMCGRYFADAADYRPTAAATCFYDVEPQERFIIETLGARGWVLSGFSGHGFKFAPVLARRLALAVDGELPAATLAAWAAGRVPAVA